MEQVPALNLMSIVSRQFCSNAGFSTVLLLCFMQCQYPKYLSTSASKFVRTIADGAGAALIKWVRARAQRSCAGGVTHVAYMCMCCIQLSVFVCKSMGIDNTAGLPHCMVPQRTVANQAYLDDIISTPDRQLMPVSKQLELKCSNFEVCVDYILIY